jgi:hypothetical protein
VSAAAEDPFPAANALLPQHEHSAGSGPAFTLDEIERTALLGNPDIRVAVRQLAVVEAHVPTAGALDDPLLMYRGWGVPLRWPRVILFADYHLRVVPARFLAGGTGRAHVPPSGLDQDVGVGVFLATFDHTGPRVDAIVHSGPLAS